jgi:hypothetical protein
MGRREGNKKDDEKIPINYDEDNKKRERMFKEIIVALFTFNILLHRTHKNFLSTPLENSRVERDFSYRLGRKYFVSQQRIGATGLLWMVFYLIGI